VASSNVQDDGRVQQHKCGSWRGTAAGVGGLSELIDDLLRLRGISDTTNHQYASGYEERSQY
jgi:hypothetical protein